MAETLAVDTHMKMDISMKPIKAESLAINVCHPIEAEWPDFDFWVTSDSKSGYQNIVSRITKPEAET
ncbi:hypothetical protein NW766_011614 [Fusarium irregulare]|uniref:Uncharacterized protein n=1 Tax=Fusarium irregulare TaxID=2494466 RepID=A0A9W8PEW1_9HYPO|nr:hypothetical protein NW766_011614 [Fusarium irregulare]